MKRIKWIIRKLFLSFQVQTKGFKMVRFGNSYGGFEVAVDLLPTDPIIYSFGIGEDLSFSEDILASFEHANVYAFDMTPKAIKYVNNNQLSKDERFHFFSVGISNMDGVVKFYLPVNEAYVSGALEQHWGLKQESIDVEVKKLKTIMNELGHHYIDVLKLDIEGSEFEVIPDILSSLGEDIGQICVEVHERFFKDGPKRWKEFKKSLNEADYTIVSVSKSRQEFTFVKSK